MSSFSPGRAKDAFCGLGNSKGWVCSRSTWLAPGHPVPCCSGSQPPVSTPEKGCFPPWHTDHGRAPAACCSGGTWLMLCCCLSGTGQEQCQAPSCSPLARAGFDFSTMREEEDRRGAVSTIWSTGWNVASWCCLKPTSRAIPLEALKVRPCFHYRQ